MFLRELMVVLALLVVGPLALSACDGNSNADSDSDGSPGESSANSTAPLICDGDCLDFVTSRLVLPTTPQLQQKLGFDFNGDGGNDNGLGTVISSLSRLVDLDAQEAVDESVAEGDALMLLRLKAADLQDAQGGRLQVWLAEEQDCCPSADTLEDCIEQAASSCFGGGATHSPAAESPEDMLFAATVEAGRLDAGPARLTIRLSLGAAEAADLVLDNARIRGEVSRDGITEGVIAGTVSREALDQVVIEPLAQVLLDRVEEGGSTAEIIEGLFDTNGDGLVTLAEVATNEVMLALFAPDVDADGDGRNELSLGLGFEAVATQIEQR